MCGLVLSISTINKCLETLISQFVSEGDVGLALAFLFHARAVRNCPENLQFLHVKKRLGLRKA